ncbi:ferredoxin reductase [Nocardioides sp. YIM 152315]|uniref:ferredoxin reductase n=1 Tax=Nocardioides sp. YIM 152315 TaxID=3031760 RepID=UPI0023DC1516|nr:ferredoxin reductase [Nocardioides sp. YIM 152315]MDF1606332.1 ferredoxin reductase [Nocardioides sp. YIM 152315]
MSGSLRRGALRWLRARLEASRTETTSARTLRLTVPGWSGHEAGQHVDVKLTAEDGYSAQRSYSIASAADGDGLELTVQAVDRGEVSPYLVEVMQPGDELELRGPIGGWFTWSAKLSGPILLVGGGSGIVPLMAMLRQRIRAGSASPFHLVYSARSPDHVFYQDELQDIGRRSRGVTIDKIFTRSGSLGDERSPGRLRAEDLPAASGEISPATGPTASDAAGRTRVYVCGPTAFVERATQLLIERGHPADVIRTERFGPTGG